MKLKKFTFILTTACNYNCSYCPQIKEKKTINNQTIETTIDFFYPFLTNDDKVHIGFYGGEPLLAYEQLKHAVLLLEEKNKRGNKEIKFSVTTNGSLLTEEMLDFFEHHQFTLQLSFDGLAQDKGRKKGTLKQMVRVMKQIQAHPGINFEINSVFSPQTIDDFSASLRFIIEQEGPDITFNISTIEEWSSSDQETLKKELAELTDFLLSYYKEKGKVPVKNFQTPVPDPVSGHEIFECNAGSDHMTVAPGGELWGCFLFHDYFKTREDSPQYRNYYFGTLPDFAVNYETRYPEIKANYTDLRQDFYQVGEREGNFCFLCEDVESCAVCPVNAAYSTGTLGKISCRHCGLVKIQRNAREDFHEKLLEVPNYKIQNTIYKQNTNYNSQITNNTPV